MRDNVHAFLSAATHAFQLRGSIYEFGTGLRGTDDGIDLASGGPAPQGPPIAPRRCGERQAGSVFCFDVLERMFDPHEAMIDIMRALAPGGTVLIASSLDLPLQQDLSDYWRLTPSCLQRLLDPLAATLVGSQGAESWPHTVFGVGVKAPLPAGWIECAHRFMDDFQEHLDRLPGRLSWRARLGRFARCWLASREDREKNRHDHRARFALSLRGGAELKRGFQPHKPHEQQLGTRLDLS